MARVRLENVTQRFGKVIAIEDISLDIPDGEFWVLVGPSGCGKSTLLRTIAGLEPITAGTLYIGDRRMNEKPARERDVAMVFQNYALYPHMTVAENLAFGLRMRRVSKAEQAKQVHQVAQSLALDHLLDRKPRQLSGGQQQRVALGRAIARRPHVFLLDEPLSNLDAQLRNETRAELKYLHQRFGITTLYVTHDQVEAMTMGDRIVMLDQGNVQQVGTPQTLYTYPANRQVAAFIGNPPMNLLAAIFDGTQFQINGQAVKATTGQVQSVSLSPNQVLMLGLRPESLGLGGTQAATLTVSVGLVEPLGRETLVRGQIPKHQPGDSLQSLKFFVPSHTLPTPGEMLTLHLNPDDLFLFDPVSGKTLYPSATVN